MFDAWVDFSLIFFSCPGDDITVRFDAVSSYKRRFACVAVRNLVPISSCEVYEASYFFCAVYILWLLVWVVGCQDLDWIYSGT